MWQLLKIELYKTFRRPRTYIAFGAIAALIILLQFGLTVDGQEYADFMLQNLGNFEVQGKMLNGYMVCYIILQLMAFGLCSLSIFSQEFTTTNLCMQFK